MYGNGAAESLIGSFLGDYDRANIYLISKFYPSHADKRQMRTALKIVLNDCELIISTYICFTGAGQPVSRNSRRPAGFAKEGLIKQYGVSNFDVDDMDQLTLEPGGDQIAANEVLYNLQSRGIEYDLLPQQSRPTLPRLVTRHLGQAVASQLNCHRN